MSGLRFIGCFVLTLLALGLVVVFATAKLSPGGGTILSSLIAFCVVGVLLISWPRTRSG